MLRRDKCVHIWRGELRRPIVSRSHRSRNEEDNGFDRQTRRSRRSGEIVLQPGFVWEAFQSVTVVRAELSRGRVLPNRTDLTDASARLTNVGDTSAGSAAASSAAASHKDKTVPTS